MELVAKGLGKAVKGKCLYQQLGFALRSGQKLVVRGPSGSGKSQLLRHLAGLDGDQEGLLRQTGQVLLDGRDLARWGAFSWRREVSYVPQQVPRLEGTPEEFEQRLRHLGAQQDSRGSSALGLTREFGLEEAHWRQPWSELSIGERQRALLAIFVAREPAVLLLDEPTAALDPQATRAVEEVLRESTCVWVTHHADQAERLGANVVSLGESQDAE